MHFFQLILCFKEAENIFALSWLASGSYELSTAALIVFWTQDRSYFCQEEPFSTWLTQIDRSFAG